MKKNIYYFCTMLFAILALQSCENDFDYIIEGEENLVGNKIIKKITNTDTGTISNFVVENGKLTNYNSGEGIFNFNIFYGENGKVNLMTDANSDDLTFNYDNDGKLISVSGTEQFPEQGFIMPIETIFEYDNLGRLIKSTTTRLIQLVNINTEYQSGFRFKNFYTYYSDNNISSITYKQELFNTVAAAEDYDSSFVPTFEVSYQNILYDDKMSVFTNLPKEFLYCYFAGTLSGAPVENEEEVPANTELVYLTSNNIVSGTYSMDFANTDEGDIPPTDFTIDYVYDSDGYPTSTLSSLTGNAVYEYQPYNP